MRGRHLGFIALIVACNHPSQRPIAAGGGGTSISSSEAVAADSAQAVLKRYLSLAIATAKIDRAAFAAVISDSLCFIDLDYDRRLWLADFKITGVALRSDTAVIRTTITAVADQRVVVESPDAGLYDVTRRPKEYDVSWTLVRDRARAPEWRVCGSATIGTEMLDVRAVGRTLRWRPAGFSQEGALRLVDSIRHARGLPIVR